MPKMKASLIDAVEQRNVEAIRALIEAGADVNARDSDGETPLMRAALWGNAEAVRVLIEAGADVNAKSDYIGQTALIHAAGYALWSRDTEIVNILIKAGADVNVVDTNALHIKEGTMMVWAVMRGDIETLLALIKAGADINAQNWYGTTPLIEAIRWRGKFIRVLIEAGADVNAQDSDGKTPLMRAAERGDDETVRALIEAGADMGRAKEGRIGEIMMATKKEGHGGVSSKKVPGITTMGEAMTKKAEEYNAKSPEQLAAREKRQLDELTRRAEAQARRLPGIAGGDIDKSYVFGESAAKALKKNRQGVTSGEGEVSEKKATSKLTKAQQRFVATGEGITVQKAK